MRTRCGATRRGGGRRGSRAAEEGRAGGGIARTPRGVAPRGGQGQAGRGRAGRLLRRPSTGSCAEASEGSGTLQQLLVYLQARRQQQLKHPSRPKCCFCLSMLSYIASGDALRRRCSRRPTGPCGWPTATCVLVHRLLMEAIADRAVLALMNEDGDRGGPDDDDQRPVRREGRRQICGADATRPRTTRRGRRPTGRYGKPLRAPDALPEKMRTPRRLRERDHAARAGRT